MSAQVRRIGRGVYVAPASPEVERDYILDLHDPVALRAAVPAGFVLVRANSSWRVYERCGRG
ncbi:MAG TPA: hypothetical protein VGX16_04470 [Solirubrobacteraceae bacterium]|nr:hypothetical protein [Solirubrobacteraceae bacterium]